MIEEDDRNSGYQSSYREGGAQYRSGLSSANVNKSAMNVSSTKNGVGPKKRDSMMSVS